MRKIVVLLLISLVTLSCTKDDDSPVTANLTGEWTWVKATGGLAGDTHTPQSTGEIITLVISNKHVARYVNGELDYDLSYTLEIKKEDGATFSVMHIEDGQISKAITLLDGDALQLSDYNVADGYRYDYVRKR